MTPKPSDSCSNQPHCRHRTPSGRRCRQPVADSDSGFCFAHVVRRKVDRSAVTLEVDRFAVTHAKDCDLADVASALTGELIEFHSAAQIHDFLSRLLLLLAQNRISPRRAAVLAYITNQLLRTLSAIEREANAQSDHDSGPGMAHEVVPALVIDLPRPNREHTN